MKLIQSLKLNIILLALLSLSLGLIRVNAETNNTFYQASIKLTPHTAGANMIKSNYGTRIYLLQKENYYLVFINLVKPDIMGEYQLKYDNKVVKSVKTTVKDDNITGRLYAHVIPSINKTFSASIRVYVMQKTVTFTFSLTNITALTNTSLQTKLQAYALLTPHQYHFYFDDELRNQNKVFKVKSVSNNSFNLINKIIAFNLNANTTQEISLNELLVSINISDYTKILYEKTIPYHKLLTDFNLQNYPNNIIITLNFYTKAEPLNEYNNLKYTFYINPNNDNEVSNDIQDIFRHDLDLALIYQKQTKIRNLKISLISLGVILGTITIFIGVFWGYLKRKNSNKTNK